MPRVALAGAVLLAAASSAQAGPPAWIEVRTANFTVVSNASEGTARRTAQQFEQIRRGVGQVWPWARLGGGKPVVVFAVRNESSLRALAPRSWQGKTFRPVSIWATRSDRAYLSLRTDVRYEDDATSNPWFNAYRGYAEIVLDSTFPSTAPRWFTGGLAEMIGNTVLSEKEIRLGLPISWHVENLRRYGRIPVATLVSIASGSPYLTDETKRRAFDAEAWALVHFLAFGEQGRHADRLNRFAALIAAGSPADGAFREALGEPASYDDPLASYVSGRIFGYKRIAATPADEPHAATVRTLSAAEADALRAGALLANGCPAEARAAADAALAADASQAVAHEVLAMMLDGQQQAEGAAARFEKAIATGQAGFHAHYRLARLLWSPAHPAESRARIGSLLRRSVELNPESASGWSFLAEIACERGPCPEAVGHAEKAVQLEPFASYHRLVLARTLKASRRDAEALAAARAGLTLARTENERRYARLLLEELSPAGR